MRSPRSSQSCPETRPGASTPVIFHRLLTVQMSRASTGQASHPVALAITSPVTYSNERLVALMESESSRTLVYSDLYLYLPCTRLPALREGIVEVPQDVVIGGTESLPLRYVTSPFVGLLDFDDLERVPVADSEDQVDHPAFHGRPANPRCRVAPPTRTTIVS